MVKAKYNASYGTLANWPLSSIVFAISIEPTMLTISEMNGSTTIDANVTIAPNDVLAVDVLLTLGFAMSEAEGEQNEL